MVNNLISLLIPKKINSNEDEQSYINQNIVNVDKESYVESEFDEDIKVRVVRKSGQRIHHATLKKFQSLVINWGVPHGLRKKSAADSSLQCTMFDHNQGL